MNFFFSSLFLSLLGLGIHVKHLKIQLCLLVIICFEFGPYFFLFVLILMLLKNIFSISSISI